MVLLCYVPSTHGSCNHLQVEPGVGDKCNPLFPHCYTAKHFLLKNGTYVYREEDFSDEDSFQKKKLLDFVNRMSFLGGAVPSIEVNINVLSV